MLKCALVFLAEILRLIGILSESSDWLLKVDQAADWLGYSGSCPSESCVISRVYFK